MFMGGNSTKATSGINGAGTRTQQAMGVPDNRDIFEEDTVRYGFNKCSTRLIVYTGVPLVSRLETCLPFMNLEEC
jgi:succinate dehydrogenase/fumarate reductase flavoprotein subunit